MSKKRSRKGEDEDEEETLQLVVRNQVGIRNEEFFRTTGVKDTVCVVVKTHVFRVELGSADGRALPNGISWSWELAYDGEEHPRKLVPVVKAPPVSATQKVGSSAGSVTFACKLTVLTSQHEGLFFRILFRGETPDGTLLEVESRPIRVISKPDSSAKKKKSAANEEEEEVAPAQPPEAKVAKLTEAEKVLADVSQLQLEAHELLRRLQHYGALRAKPDNAVVQEGAVKHLDFEACFTDLLEAYGRLVGQAERTRRARHVAGLLPSMAPLFQLQDLSTSAVGGAGDSGRFSGQFVSYENDASMVTFNDMFVAVQPTPATTTTVIIDGHDFNILDFGFEETGCSCKNCNWKIECDRADGFARAAFPDQ